MFQALALRALVQGNIKSKRPADPVIVKDLCVRRCLKCKIFQAIRNTTFFFMNITPTPQWAIDALKAANQVAKQAKQEGHHPFGAILLAPDMRTILDQQGNLDTVNHAESTLAKRAFASFDSNYLWLCTLVTTVEPCAMCSGTQYWANIGRLVYGLSERALLDLTGNHAQNPTLDLPSRLVFDAGQKKVEVLGPVREMQEEIISLHLGFWNSP